MRAGKRTGSAPRKETTSRPRPKRTTPHSEWQKMVDSRQMELGVSWRALTDSISSEASTFAHTTVWAWTKNPEGYPPPASYTEEVNDKLAMALQIRPEVLAQAYENSRRHLILTDKNASQRGPLSVLRKLIADSRQETWTSSEVVRLIDDLMGN